MLVLFYNYKINQTRKKGENAVKLPVFLFIIDFN